MVLAVILFIIIILLLTLLFLRAVDKIFELPEDYEETDVEKIMQPRLTPQGKAVRELRKARRGQ